AVAQFERSRADLRICGDMRDITGTVGQAKMHAAADFTHGRARANLVANTFQLETWNKAGNGGAGCWQTVGDPTNPCTIGASPIQPLSTGVTFGFGAMTAPPPNTTADRKSTRLNSSHGSISYAVFCLKKKKTTINIGSATN